MPINKSCVSNLFCVLCLCILPVITGACNGSSTRKDAAPILREAISYSTKSIRNLQQIEGQPHWIENERQQILYATWTFNPDGTFAFNAPDLREDLFPLLGQFNCDSKLCTFAASASSRTGSTGSAAAHIEGTIDFNGVDPVLEMFTLTSSGNAASVNNTGFAQANASSYTMEVILQ